MYYYYYFFLFFVSYLFCCSYCYYLPVPYCPIVPSYVVCGGPQAIRNIRHRGGRTNIAGAIELAREQIFRVDKGDRDAVPNYLIIFTDGTPTVRQLDTIPEAVAARIAGIQVIVAGVGDNMNAMEMMGMASAPQARNVMSVARFKDIGSLVSKIVASVCDGQRRWPPAKHRRN